MKHLKRLTESDRIVRAATAARVNAMESELKFLRKMYCSLEYIVDDAQLRIRGLERSIAAEKASVTSQDHETKP